MACKYCPFAFTDASEHVQNYGCLPSAYDIIQMKKKSGHNWACHNNEKTICKGFVDYVKNGWLKGLKEETKDIDTSKGNLISYETWYYKGEEAAIEEANNRGTSK